MVPRRKVVIAGCRGRPKSSRCSGCSEEKLFYLVAGESNVRAGHDLGLDDTGRADHDILNRHGEGLLMISLTGTGEYTMSYVTRDGPSAGTGRVDFKVS